MSFGFGPGDIVAFIAFGKKVFDALQDDDGSTFEYRNAAAQCQAFGAVMSDVQRLDLSYLPEDFRKQLEVHSKNVREHVAAFKKHTVDKFEKSMGEETKRGWFKGAPRKVQWAFGAADDLDKFRVSLGAWLQIIQMSIQFRFLDRSMLLEALYSGPYILPRANSGTGQPSTRLALPNSETQRYIQWRPETVEDLRLTGAMSEISNLVYERLLSRPGPLTSEGRKVFTLPADDGAEADFLAGNGPNAQSSLVHPSAVSTPASKNIPSVQTGDPGDAFNTDTADNAIVQQTNHYLAELQLPLLTDAETARLVERSSDAHTALLPGYKRDNQDETPR